MGYATLTDLVNVGLPANALGSLTTTQQQEAIDNATDKMNTYFAGRWPLPLLTWDHSVTAKCGEIAAYKLMCIRGFNPASGADVNFRLRYQDAIKWCEGVRNKAIHPTVTFSDLTPAYAQPSVTTYSMVTTGGGRGPQRGW